MPRGKKKRAIANCSALNFAFIKQCASCRFIILFKKPSGRQTTNTKASDGKMLWA